MLTKLINKDIKVFVYATGAGAGFQQKLWQIPGCSNILVGCGFPYSAKLTSEVIGYTPDKYVSIEMSIELAMAAYRKAYDVNNLTSNFIGIGLTAVVTSVKPHRAEHQIIITGISNTQCLTRVIILTKGEVGAQTRMMDGFEADNAIEQMLLNLAGEDYNKFNKYLDTSEQAKIVLMKHPFYDSGVKQPYINHTSHVHYPGTFNPLHAGHITIKDYVTGMLKENIDSLKVIFNYGITPKHKAPPLISDLLQKIEQMKDHSFLLTQNDPLFVDKVRSGKTKFIIGVDALLTMLDPKWGIPIQELLDFFYQHEVFFLVATRQINETLVTLQDVQNAYPEITNYLGGFLEFSPNISLSSTEIRQQRSHQQSVQA